MSFAPADFPGFGGLDLRDPEDASGATSIFNVVVGDPTRISRRPGYTLTGSATYAPVTYPSAICPIVLKHVVGGNTYVTITDSAGTNVAQSTSQTTSTSPWSFARYAPGACTYGVNGSNQNILKATDAAITNPTVTVDGVSGKASPRCYALLIQPNDNRLMCIGATTLPDAVTGSSAHVMFSQPNDPQVYDSGDWVKLGQGGAYLAGAVFRGNAMAFSGTNFAVFYGNSVDSTGGAVFNYRLVDMPAPGGWALNAGYVVAGTRAVYVIIPGSGVWATTGGPMTKVSTVLDSAFRDGSYAPQPMGTAFAHGGKVYFPLLVSSVDGYWLVLDEESGMWSLYKYLLPFFCGVGYIGDILLPSRTSGMALATVSDATDAGTAVTGYYASQYSAYGEPKAEKHVRATELHGTGTGTVTLAWGVNSQAHGTAETVAMSSGLGHARTGARGRTLSWKVSGTGAWTLNRVVPLVQTVRTGR